MHFELTEDQKLLSDSVRDFVKRELPVERMRKMRQNDHGFDKAVWKQMGELGWLGIALPEEVGGFGGNFVDASIILERFGTTLVSEPFTESVLVAAHPIAALGSAAQKERWLVPMLAGDTVLALAWAEADGRYDAARLATRAERSGNGYRLAGGKRWVLPAHADQVVVSARTSGGEADRAGVSLFVVDASSLDATPVKTMDGRRAAMLSFDCTVEADRLLGEEGRGLEALEAALDRGAAAACCEGVGVMNTSLSMTVEYLKTREQFGVRIGTFQALQHRAVDMFIEAQLSKSMAIMAAIKVDDPDPRERQRGVSAAKAQIVQSGKLVTQQAIQLHGGIGVTDEHDIGLFFKRMHALSVLYGDEPFHVRRYASLMSE